MTVGSRTRRTGFWLLDRVKGRPIRTQYDDVRSLMESGQSSRAVLADLLDHASRTTRSYAPYAGAELDAYPVLDKAALKRRPDDFRSNAYDQAHVHYAATSGSTGTPLRVAHDRAKRRRAIADLVYFNELAGQRVGDRMVWLRAWTGRVKPRHLQLLQNIVPIELAGLDGPAMANIERILRTRTVNCILGYTSALDAISRYLDSSDVAGDFGLQVVIAGAETMQPGAKERIEGAFGCPLVDRYANEENGLLASTLPGTDGYRLNHASYHFEFLRTDADEPAALGSLARVVVTDLFNRAWPMIRYDTGDLAVLAEVDGQGEPRVMQRIEGRRSDVLYDTSGGMQTELTLSDVFKRFPEIARYKVIQEQATTYRVLICLGGSNHREADFAAPLVELLGPDAEVIVEFRDEIPSQPNAKFRPFVREWQPPSGTAMSEEVVPRA